MLISSNTHTQNEKDDFAEGLCTDEDSTASIGVQSLKRKKRRQHIKSERGGLRWIIGYYIRYLSIDLPNMLLLRFDLLCIIGPPISTASGFSWRSACSGFRTQIDMDIMEVLYH